MNIIAAENVPPLSAPLILSVDVLLANIFTIKIPAIEQSKPSDARAKGRNMSGDNHTLNQSIKFYTHEITQTKKILIEYHLKYGQKRKIKIEYDYSKKLS